jgi:hypothetical protein
MNNIVYIPAFNNFIAWFPGVRESWKQYCAEHELALFIDTKKIEPFAKYMPWWGSWVLL